MLKARPEVHGDRAQLDLRHDVFRPVGEVDGHLDVHVQRAVAVVVRRLDVVLLFDDLHIRLPRQHLAHAVDIVDVAANDAHARDVVDVFRADSIESGRPRLMSLATMLDCDLTRPSM